MVGTGIQARGNPQPVSIKRLFQTPKTARAEDVLACSCIHVPEPRICPTVTGAGQTAERQTSVWVPEDLIGAPASSTAYTYDLVQS